MPDRPLLQELPPPLGTLKGTLLGNCVWALGSLDPDTTTHLSGEGNRTRVFVASPRFLSFK